MKTTDERKGLPSCSAFARYDSCPGSWWLAQKAPPSPPTPEGTQGTLIHDVLAGVEPPEILDDAQRDIWEACEIITKDAIETIGVPKHAAINPEVRYWFYDACSGKADLCAIWDRKAWIHDHKTGREDVDAAPRNLQLMGLVACIHANHPLDEAWVSIGGPFQREKLTIARYSRSDIEYATQRTWEILAKISRKDAPRIPGDHCRYCPAKAICPELQNKALEPLKSLQEASVVKTKDDIARAAKSLSDGQLEALMSQYRLRSWANDAIYQEAKRRLIGGKSLKGWALEPGTTRKKVKDVMALFARCQTFASPEEFCSKASMGNTALKELVKEKLQLKGKDLKAKVDELMDGIVEETTTEPSLVEVDYVEAIEERIPVEQSNTA